MGFKDALFSVHIRRAVVMSHCACGAASHRLVTDYRLFSRLLIHAALYPLPLATADG